MFAAAQNTHGSSDTDFQAQLAEYLAVMQKTVCPHPVFLIQTREDQQDFADEELVNPSLYQTVRAWQLRKST